MKELIEELCCIKQYEALNAEDKITISEVITALSSMGGRVCVWTLSVKRGSRYFESCDWPWYEMQHEYCPCCGGKVELRAALDAAKEE